MKIENVAQVAALVMVGVTGILALFVVIVPMFTGTSTTPLGEELTRTLVTFSIGLVSGAGLGVGYGGMRAIRATEMVAMSIVKQNNKDSQ